MANPAHEIRERIKTALDRRYALADETSTEVADLTAQLDEIATRLDAMTSRLDRHLESEIKRRDRASVDEVKAMAAIAERASLGASFVATEDPHELRKKLFDAHRLANESARAIELLLQSELLLRRDIDSVLDDSGPLSKATHSDEPQVT